ncbi:MAG: glycoside hydrolase [Phycisphaerae bacterium]|nr:glycoside hydrolase [Phycisphaerae bacterium]
MKSFIGLVVVKLSIVCMLFCSMMPVSDAKANQLCKKEESIDVLKGEYRIGNNIWGKLPGDQCMDVDPNSTYFTVLSATHNTPNSVEAYPFIYKGCHFGGDCTVDSGMPVKINEIESAPFVWSVDPNGAAGNWNVAFESWFSSTGGISPDKAELMIWINYQRMACGGKIVEKAVPIGGYTWDVYHSGSHRQWEHYIAYRITTPVNDVNLDLKDFIDDSIKRGYIDPAWYLDNMEAGFELMVGGQGMTNKSFSASVKKKEPLKKPPVPLPTQ